MATVGELAVKLVGNSDGFTRALRAGRGEFDLIRSGLTALKGLAVGFGATLAAGLAISSLKSTASEIDELAKDATRLGIATDKLQGLERFGQLSGANSGEIVAGLSKMEVAINKGAAVFAKLKLNAAELKQLKPEEEFLRVAERIKALENPSTRMAAVKDIFGMGGASLLPTIMQGSSAIAGGTDRYGTVTAEQAKDIEAAVKAGRELSMAFTDLKTLYVAELAPGLTKFLKRLVDWLNGKKSNPYTGLIAKMTEAEFRKFQHDVESHKVASMLYVFNKRMLYSEFYITKRLGIDWRKNGTVDAGLVLAAMRERQDAMNQAAVDKHKKLGYSDPEDRVRVEQAKHAKEAADAQQAQALFMRSWMTMTTLNIGGQTADPFAGQQERKDLAEKKLGELDKGRKRIMHDAGAVTTSSALEKGTAAAFSQERRSQTAASELTRVEHEKMSVEREINALVKKWHLSRSRN